MARRGLSLGSKLLLASLLLLTLPWLAWRALVTFEAFLADGQLRALELLADGAALLLQPHVARLAGATGSGTTVVYAWPLDADHAFDGFPGDWHALPDTGLTLGEPAAQGRFGLRLRLGTRDGWLHGLAEVRDAHPAYRNPGQTNLRASDQLRVELHGDDGVSRYRVITAEGPGRAEVLASTPDGAQAVAAPELGLEARWQPAGDGYTVEFRLPLGRLVQHPVLRIAVHDTGGTHGSGRDLTSPPLRPRYRDPELERVLAGLGPGAARLWVVDRDGWVRAGVGGLAATGAALDRLDPSDLPPLAGALGGHATSARLAHDVERLVAAAPLAAATGTVGAVLVEQRLDDLLRLRYRTFADFTLASLALIGASAAALLLFAARLAWRIRRLGREAGAAIDARGRQVGDRLAAEARSGDELGELSRTISALLARLRRHTRFVESLPGTLRHELSNPLNGIATALHNLAEEPEPTVRADLLARAGRGLERVERTLTALTEAADLEEALRGDPRARLDLAALLRGYLESFAMQHPARQLTSDLPGTPAWIEGVDYRLEQLLDKLLDNAVDFTPPTGRIEVGLAKEGDSWRLEVTNDGPPLPDGMEGRLFETLVSGRPHADGAGGHLGLGLYVVRRIAEAHGGCAEAATRADGAGARFTVQLPAAP